VILFRQPAKYRAWWDTDFSRNWFLTGLLALLWAQHFTPIPHMPADNDKDHLRW
jgi:hypothetical protein